MGCCPTWCGASGLPSSPQSRGSLRNFPSLRDQHKHLLDEVLTCVWFFCLEHHKARVAERPLGAKGKEEKLQESRG